MNDTGPRMRRGRHTIVKTRDLGQHKEGEEGKRKCERKRRGSETIKKRN